MKSLIFISFCLLVLGAAVQCTAQPESSVGFVKSIDNDNVRIIEEEVVIINQEVVPADQTWVVLPGGSIRLAKGGSLTMAGKFVSMVNAPVFTGTRNVRFESGSVDYIDATWFGAIPNDGKVDTRELQSAIDAGIYSTGVSVVYLPPGEFLVDAPLLLLRDSKGNGKYEYFNLTLVGHQSPYSDNENIGGVSVLKAADDIPFVIGIQAARGVEIVKLLVQGVMGELSKEDVYLKDSGDIYPQKRFAPNAGVVIDPFCDNLPEDGGYTGLERYYTDLTPSARVRFDNTSIVDFPAGVVVSPNGVSKKADTINFTYSRIRNAINAIVVCQSQSRNIVVDNCTFQRVKYVYNCDEFGEQTGIIPETNNIKIAAGVAWLFRANGNWTYGHFNGIYAESLYGIGYSKINKHPFNFESCTLKFTQDIRGTSIPINPCVLKAGNASFRGCTIMYGQGGDADLPLVFDVDQLEMTNCVMDIAPLNTDKDNTKKNSYTNSTYRKREASSAKGQGVERSANDSREPAVTAGTSCLVDQKVDYTKLDGDEYELAMSTSCASPGSLVVAEVRLAGEPFSGTKTTIIAGEVVRSGKGKVVIKSSSLGKKQGSIYVIELL